MIVDSSAILAVFFEEPEAARIVERLLFKGDDFTRTDIAAAL